MCRIVISIGTGKILYPFYPKLIESLYKAAKYDPYSIDLFGKEEKSHRDGWGRLNIQVLDEDVSITLIKSLKPVYEERPPIRLSLSPFEDYINETFFIDMFHARAGSTGMPRNIFSVHPFQDETRRGNMIYLIHNGAVYKEPILEELGIDENSDYARLYTDSYFLTKYIARSIDNKLDKKVIVDALRFTKTALNLGVVLVADGHIDIVVGSYYLKGDNPNAMKNYYKIYKSTYEDAIVYVSSTIVDFPEYRPKDLLKWSELENGRYDRIRIRYKPKISVIEESWFIS